MPTLVPYGEWLPDLPAFQAPGATTMTNVVPKTPESYGPVRQISASGTALASRCMGAVFARDASGNSFGFAGDATKLYIKQASADWADVSKSGGYTTATDERWSFVQFGEQIIALNFANPPQEWTFNSSTAFANLSSGAPQARYGARVRDFVMLANTSDAVDGNRPQRVWWSAIGDAATWPTPGSVSAAAVQSDYQDLLGEGGWNRGIVGGLSGADVAIVQERAVWRGQYAGPPAIFAFQTIESARGTPAPGSIVSVGPVFYYIADDGFYVCDGVTSIPIGQNKVDRYFWNDVDQSFLYRVTAAADPLNKLIFWAYPNASATNGNPNRILAYHYGLSRWSLIDGVEMDCFIKEALTIGYTLEDLDAFGTLETLPFPLDSSVWTGGRLSLACFSTAHKLATFSGDTLAATLETGEAMLNPRGSSHVSRVWPMVDTAAATMAVGKRDLQSASVTWGTATALTTTTGSCPLRSTGRYHRARVSISAAAAWNDAQGVMFEARAAGRR